METYLYSLKLLNKLKTKSVNCDDLKSSVSTLLDTLLKFDESFNLYLATL